MYLANPRTGTILDDEDDDDEDEDEDDDDDDDAGAGAGAEPSSRVATMVLGGLTSDSMGATSL